MGREIYDIINDMAEVLNASQMQKLQEVLDTINIPVIKITTEMLRKYLVEYQTTNNCGKEPNNFQFVEQIRNKQQQLGEPHDFTHPWVPDWRTVSCCCPS